MPEPTPRRVVVVGGGILGASTAARLARRGVDVTLQSEGTWASGASGRSLGWLNSYGHRSAAYHELRMLGLERYRALAAEEATARFLHLGGG